MGILDVAVGKVAFVKTTKEPVFVLAVNTESNEALVRRPVSSDAEGVDHKTEGFSLAELETEEAKILDEIRIRKFAYEQNQLASNEAKTPKVAGDELVN